MAAYKRAEVEEAVVEPFFLPFFTTTTLSIAITAIAIPSPIMYRYSMGRELLFRCFELGLMLARINVNVYVQGFGIKIYLDS